MTEDYLKELQADMDKAIEALRREMTGIRTGRATPALIENVQVEVATYGSTMPLRQLGNIAAPDPRLLIVNPWDKSTLGDIDRAIRSSGLGLNPTSDGQVVKVPIPALTNDRRKDMVKVLGRHAEAARIRIRGVRREYNEIFKTLADEKDITEDERDRAIEKVQKATDSHVKKVDEIAASKEKEILEI